MQHHDRAGNPVTLKEWAELVADNRVARSEVDGYTVSTVWLGFDFETMVFTIDSNDIYCRRYTTEQHAIEGHQAAIQWVKDGCKR